MKFLIILIQNCKYSLLYFYLALYISTHGIIYYIIYLTCLLFNLLYMTTLCSVLLTASVNSKNITICSSSQALKLKCKVFLAINYKCYRQPTNE